MGKNKGVFDAATAAAFAGKTGGKVGITQYFKEKEQPKKRGRPTKNSRGRKKARCLIDIPQPEPTKPPPKKKPAAKPDDVSPPPSPRKKTRRNWGTGEDRVLMEKAIDNWFNGGKLKYDDNGEEIMDCKIYAHILGIPSKSLYNYIHPDESKRFTLGDGSRGKKKILDDNEVEFAGALLTRADRGNEGLSRKEATDMIQEMKPDISRETARRQLSRRVIPVNAAAGMIKGKTQKVQSTTSDRTNINVGQQYRWHTAVTDLYNGLETKNTGLCNKTNKTFPWVMHHFIIGLDEMCLMSDAHGTLHIIGAADKKKHEKILQDSRVSITIVRTGTVGGTTGPTIFLIKGEKVKPHFTDDWLVRHGCAVGSTIIPTENAYMTDDAWKKTSEAIVKGYRHLPYIKENPDWWVGELLDGFKSHENVLTAHELRYEHKIISLREESNSSHANQGYDQLVAKNDKKVAAETLYEQRKLLKSQTSKSNITQYDLIVTGIHLVNSTNGETVSLFGLYAYAYLCYILTTHTYTHLILFLSGLLHTGVSTLILVHDFLSRTGVERSRITSWRVRCSKRRMFNQRPRKSMLSFQPFGME